MNFSHYQMLIKEIIRAQRFLKQVNEAKGKQGSFWRFYYLSQMGPMKRFKNKKAMWVTIALDIEDETGHCKTAEQCQNRFRTIKKEAL